MKDDVNMFNREVEAVLDHIGSLSAERKAEEDRRVVSVGLAAELKAAALAEASKCRTIADVDAALVGARFSEQKEMLLRRRDAICSAIAEVAQRSCGEKVDSGTVRIVFPVPEILAEVPKAAHFQRRVLPGVGELAFEMAETGEVVLGCAAGGSHASGLIEDAETR